MIIAESCIRNHLHRAARRDILKTGTHCGGKNPEKGKMDRFAGIE